MTLLVLSIALLTHAYQADAASDKAEIKPSKKISEEAKIKKVESWILDFQSAKTTSEKTKLLKTLTKIIGSEEKSTGRAGQMAQQFSERSNIGATKGDIGDKCQKFPDLCAGEVAPSFSEGGGGIHPKTQVGVKSIPKTQVGVKSIPNTGREGGQMAQQSINPKLSETTGASKYLQAMFNRQMPSLQNQIQQTKFDISEPLTIYKNDGKKEVFIGLEIANVGPEEEGSLLYNGKSFIYEAEPGIRTFAAYYLKPGEFLSISPVTKKVTGTYEYMLFLPPKDFVIDGFAIDEAQPVYQNFKTKPADWMIKVSSIKGAINTGDYTLYVCPTSTLNDKCEKNSLGQSFAETISVTMPPGGAIFHESLQAPNMPSKTPSNTITIQFSERSGVSLATKG